MLLISFNKFTYRITFICKIMTGVSYGKGFKSMKPAKRNVSYRDTQKSLKSSKSSSSSSRSRAPVNAPIPYSQKYYDSLSTPKKKDLWKKKQTQSAIAQAPTSEFAPVPYSQEYYDSLTAQSKRDVWRAKEIEQEPTTLDKLKSAMTENVVTEPMRASIEPYAQVAETVLGPLRPMRAGVAEKLRYVQEETTGRVHEFFTPSEGASGLKKYTLATAGGIVGFLTSPFDIGMGLSAGIIEPPKAGQREVFYRGEQVIGGAITKAEDFGRFVKEEPIQAAGFATSVLLTAGLAYATSTPRTTRYNVSAGKQIVYSVDDVTFSKNIHGIKSEIPRRFGKPRISTDLLVGEAYATKIKVPVIKPLAGVKGATVISFKTKIIGAGQGVIFSPTKKGFNVGAVSIKSIGPSKSIRGVSAARYKGTILSKGGKIINKTFKTTKRSAKTRSLVGRAAEKTIFPIKRGSLVAGISEVSITGKKGLLRGSSLTARMNVGDFRGPKISTIGRGAKTATTLRSSLKQTTSGLISAAKARTFQRITPLSKTIKLTGVSVGASLRTITRPLSKTRVSAATLPVVKSIKRSRPRSVAITTTSFKPVIPKLGSSGLLLKGPKSAGRLGATTVSVGVRPESKLKFAPRANTLQRSQAGLIFKTAELQKQRPKLATLQKPAFQVPRVPLFPLGPSGTPWVPPPPILFPPTASLWSSPRSFKFRATFKQPKKYQTSLIAREFKIKGKRPKRLTGLEIRPL